MGRIEITAEKDMKDARDSLDQGKSPMSKEVNS